MMKMQDVLFEECLTQELTYETGEPCYDKTPGVSSYVFDEDRVVEVKTPHRVVVPMAEAKDIEQKMLTLIKDVASRQDPVEWDGSFECIQSHFAKGDLPLDVVLKNPETDLDVPTGVKTVDHPGVEPDRFFCLTRSDLLGRLPKVSGTVERSPDKVGFLIFSPHGVLTVFLPMRRPSSFSSPR